MHKTAEITSVVNQSSVVFTASVIFNNNTYTDTKTVARNGKIYLTINSNWGNDGARFAACFSKDGNESWIDLTETDYDGIYSGLIPAGDWTNVTFCRMNPAKPANSWDNKWNQTNSQRKQFDQRMESDQLSDYSHKRQQLFHDRVRRMEFRKRHMESV